MSPGLVPLVSRSAAGRKDQDQGYHVPPFIFLSKQHLCRGKRPINSEIRKGQGRGRDPETQGTAHKHSQRRAEAAGTCASVEWR